MNIELKPIAESKIRQLGGDVCGVLVRTEDSEVMAVSEHGRCNRLDAGVMGPVELGASDIETERKRFMASFEGKADLSWLENAQQFASVRTQNLWESWQIMAAQFNRQAARAQGDAEPVNDFRAEIRTERDHCDEYASFLVFVSAGKSQPYMFIPETLDQEVLDAALRRLNPHPPKAQAVPEGITVEMLEAIWQAGIDAENYDARDFCQPLIEARIAIEESATPQPEGDTTQIEYSKLEEWRDTLGRLLNDYGDCSGRHHVAGFAMWNQIQNQLVEAGKSGVYDGVLPGNYESRTPPVRQGSVPKGWKLVPVEPTGDMEEAGCQGYMEADGNWVMHRSSMGFAYKAMLEAAPQPPQEGSGDE